MFALTYLFLLPVLAKEASEIAINVPETTPDKAVPVSGDFFGFGLETDQLPLYDNDITERAIRAINDRMGKPLVLRIGGNTGDEIISYHPGQKVPICKSKKDCEYFKDNVLDIGPSYFDIFKRLAGTSIIIQAPMRPHWKLENTLAYVKLSWDAIGGTDHVSAIALGNEPNFYNFGNGQNAKDYVKAALEIESQIIKNLSLTGDDMKIFQVGEIASRSVAERDAFNLMDVMEAQINKNKKAKYAADHLYQIRTKLDKYSPQMLQEKLMNQTSIMNALEPYKADSDQLKAKYNSLPLVISEFAGVVGGSFQFSGGFGAALWAVDFHLAAMSIGIERVCNNQILKATHSFWFPRDPGDGVKGPAINGVFPAAAFIADFVGEEGSLGKVRGLGGFDNELFTAYASYSLDSKEPQRVALVNLKVYEEGGSKRSAKELSLNVTGVKSASVRRLSAKAGVFAHGFDVSNGKKEEFITWHGEQWSWKANELKAKSYPNGEPKKETLKVQDGKLKLNVSDSEAVIVDLQY